MKTKSNVSKVRIRSYLIFAVLATMLTPRASAGWGDWWNWGGSGAKITSQPVSATVNPGATVTFTVTASGSPAPTFQWLLQDIPIPGATSASLMLTNVQPADGGAYSVRAQNSNGSDRSNPALLAVTVSALPFANAFASSGEIVGLTGVGSGNNSSASTEAYEPRHHPGAKNHRTVWLKWTAPDYGTMSINTAGSAFDSVLAAYTGTSLTNLQLVANDDDSGGYENARFAFYARAGTTYSFVVSSADSAGGNIVLAWNLVPTTVVLSGIAGQPAHTSLNRGEALSLVVSLSETNALATVQWFFETAPIPGATNTSLVIPNFQDAGVGIYRSVVTSAGVDIPSQGAEVQINTEGAVNVVMRNRQEDASLTGLRSGPITTSGLRRRITSVSGYSGTQVFATRSGKDPGEPNHCGVVGGSSYWLSYVPGSTGIMTLNTDGSSYDTILAVYLDDGLGNGYASLISVACDNNSGTNGLTSKLQFNATAGLTYYIVVDGVNGAYGTAYLNYDLNVPPTITAIAPQIILEDNNTGALAFTISDFESAATNLTVTATSSNTNLVRNTGLTLGGSGGSRTVLVTPIANSNGVVNITVTVTDPDGLSASTVFAVTVIAVNDAPTAGTDTLNRPANYSVSVLISTLLANDKDVDGDTITLTATSSLSYLGATITKDATRVYYTARYGYNTPDYFTYTISDGHGGTATGRVNVYTF